MPADEFDDEEARAAAWRQSAVNRRLAAIGRALRLLGNPAEAMQVRQDWGPLRGPLDSDGTTQTISRDNIETLGRTENRY